MIVVMERTATEGEIADVVERLTAAGCRVHRLDAERVTLGATGGKPDAGALEALPGVAAALDDTTSPLVTGAGAPAARDARGQAERPATPGPDRRESAHPESGDRGFAIDDRWVGGEELFVIAGPCSVEEPDIMESIAAGVAKAGAIGLRAGAYKPRTSPYSFQGVGEEGLVTLRRAADRHGLLVVSEVLDATQIPIAVRYCDILQVGARNMHNTSLLRELGRARRPVLLKRGLAATIDEWLDAAEYVVSGGNRRVILCERGIRTFETATRNTLDLNAVPAVRARSRLPILVDPSHGTGHRDYVAPMALAAVAAGADGLMIEAHVTPDQALSDGRQTISLETLAALMSQARMVASLLSTRSA
jgi:3-deoxy-7-phosphoheptulonate synthase